MKTLAVIFFALLASAFALTFAPGATAGNGDAEDMFTAQISCIGPNEFDPNGFRNFHLGMNTLFSSDFNQCSSQGNSNNFESCTDLLAAIDTITSDNDCVSKSLQFDETYSTHLICRGKTKEMIGLVTDLCETVF